MTGAGWASANTTPLWILAAVAAAFFLRSARELLIPIALAGLISYALEPLVAWLERRRVPRLAGTTLVLITIFAAAAGGLYAFRAGVMQALELLPRAAERIRAIVLPQAVTEAGAVSLVPSALIEQAAGSILSVAGNAVVVFFLVFFLLLAGHRLRDRLVELAGHDPERQRTASTIISEINAQIQQYLLVLLVTAAVVALLTWAALAWMGVRYAAMWGILAGVFNSIPYFGPVIVSGGLLVVGLIEGGSLIQALQMSGAAVVITSLEGWLLTPPLMGRAERMNALTVFLGLLLWTWLWGAWGTILAVPMLVVVKSIADHTDRFKPLGRLMAP